MEGNEKQTECSKEKNACGCKRRCGGGLSLVLLFLVGGIIGYLVGQRRMSHRMMAPCPMTAMPTPPAPPEK